jgi:hypothetical protein
VIAEREHYTASAFTVRLQTQTSTTDDTDKNDLHGSKKFTRSFVFVNPSYPSSSMVGFAFPAKQAGPLA